MQDQILNFESKQICQGEFCELHDETNDFICIDKQCGYFLTKGCTSCLNQVHDHKKNSKFLKLNEFLEQLQNYLQNINPHTNYNEENSNIKNKFDSLADQWEKLAKKCWQISTMLRQQGQQYSNPESYTSDLVGKFTEQCYNDHNFLRLVSNNVYLKRKIKNLINWNELNTENLEKMKIDNEYVIKSENLGIFHSNTQQSIQIAMNKYIKAQESLINKMQKLVQKGDHPLCDYKNIYFIKEKEPIYEKIKEVKQGFEFQSCIDQPNIDNQIVSNAYFSQGKHGFTVEFLSISDFSGELVVGLQDEDSYQRHLSPWTTGCPYSCLLGKYNHNMIVYDCLQQLFMDGQKKVKVVLDFSTNQFQILDSLNRIMHFSKDFQIQGGKFRFYINFHRGQYVHLKISEVF